MFQNFRNKGIETYELDPCSLDQLSAPELAWKSFFKKTKIELELSTNTDMQQLIEKGIRNGIYHPTYRHAKVNNKYTKGYNKDNKSPYLIYWDANNFYGWIISKKLSWDNFQWEENLFKFYEIFIKRYNQNSYKAYVIEVDDKYPKPLHNL